MYSLKIIIWFIFSSLIFLSCHQPKRIQQLKNNLSGYTVRTAFGQCEVILDEVDPLTGVRKTDLAPEKLFSFTHERLRPYFQDEPFMVCFGNLSSVDKEKLILQLQFVFSSNKLKTNYNGLAEESMLQLSLINGEKLLLNNIIQDEGQPTAEQKIVFQGLFILKKSDVKLLEKYELDRMGVLWKGGYEDYNMHNIDFFIRQIACIDRID